MKNLGYRFIVITVKRKCALNYLSSHWPLRSGVTLFPCLVKGEHAEDAGVCFGVFQGKNLRAKKETPTNLPWKPLSRQVKFQDLGLSQLRGNWLVCTCTQEQVPCVIEVPYSSASWWPAMLVHSLSVYQKAIYKKRSINRTFTRRSCICQIARCRIAGRLPSWTQSWATNFCSFCLDWHFQTIL